MHATERGPRADVGTTIFLPALLALAAGATPLRARAQQPDATITPPVITTIGALPPADATATIALAANGTLWLDGTAVTLAQLHEQLPARAWPDGPPPAATKATSRLNVLIRADATVAFAAVARIVDLCGEPTIAVRQLFFAVATKSGREGAFALFLPTELRPAPALELSAHYRDVGVATSSVLGHVRKVTPKDGQPESHTLALRVAPEVPLGRVLEILDFAAQAEAEGATLWLDDGSGTPQDAAWRRSELAELAAHTADPAKPLSLTVSGARIANSPAPQSPPRVLGEYAGFTSPGVWAPGALGLREPLVTDLPPRLDPNGLYGLRSGKRPTMARGTEMAIGRALDWLSLHQDEDGRWDSDQFMKHDREGAPGDGPGKAEFDAGITGLALLALLADGHTLAAGSRREEVRRGCEWLRNEQHKNGDSAGWLGGQGGIYCHAIAALALVEAYAVSGISGWRDCAQRAVDNLEARRNPYSVWRYKARDNDNDSSVTGWCVAVMASARHARLRLDDANLELAKTWFQMVTDQNGRTGYTRPGETSARLPGDHGTRFPREKGEAITGIGLFAFCMLGCDPKELPLMRAQADLVKTKPPVWDEKGGSIDLYYWYYGSQAMAQMGGKYAADWRRMLEAALVKAQRRDGNFDGSWDPIDAWGEMGGRVYSTAMAALALEAPYRYASWR